MGRTRHASFSGIAWVCLAVLGGCAHRTEQPTTEPGAALDDPAARASRDNAALRRRVQMLEDRVLHLEHSGRGAGAPGAAPGTGPDGRSLPVVRLQADPSHGAAPTPSPAGVSASTWQSTTAAAATTTTEDPAAGIRRSRTIGTQPSVLPATDDEIGGFAGAADPVPSDSARSYRLVGSRLAELSKTERKPQPAAAPPKSRSKSRSKNRGRDQVLSRYEDAMALLKAGHADAAQAAFDGIVRDSPRHDYADNALYWKGEAAYDQRHFADALAAFTRVVEQYGGGNKAPDALLKIGLCYENLGDRANARDVLTELIAAYPAARATGIARVKLAELSAAGSAAGGEG